MNENRTGRLEIMIGTVFTGFIMIALAIYIWLEPARIETAQVETLSFQLDDAMSLYAENCAVCHGVKGEGIGSIPALDNPALKTMDTEELFKTIARGRFNTAMPAWSQEDSGPLSEYQIDELVYLIQYGDWKETQDRVVNLGLAPLIPFTTDPDPVLLAQVANLPDGVTLQTAITIFASQCVSCHGADGLGTNIAPALNDPLVRKKTADEINRTITFGSAGTLMAGWSNVLSTEDISALVTLIQRWDEVPLGMLPAPDVPIPTTAESIALGGDLYAANCAQCHAPEGQGTQRAPSLNVKSFLTDTSDLAMEQIITNGVPGTAMPAWGTRMSAADIQAIVGFIRQWEPTAPEVASPIRGAGGPPWLRNNTSTGSTTGTTTTPATGTNQPSAGQGNQGAGHTTTVAAEPAQSPLDWRILLGITIILAAAFSLISAGVSSLKRHKDIISS
jgi:mono/diheme cytochrome c family protein